MWTQYFGDRQKVNPEGIEGVDLTRKSGIVYDKDTFMTKIPGVFAGGDCGNEQNFYCSGIHR